MKKNNTSERRTTAIRYEIEYYSYIKENGILNNRSISGQANWMCKVHLHLKEHYPDIYAEICKQLDLKN